MVRLTAKGQNRFVDANTPSAVAKSESVVVLAALRSAVEALVDASSGSWTHAMVNEALVLKDILDEIHTEANELSLILHVVEKRMMEL